MEITIKYRGRWHKPYKIARERISPCYVKVTRYFTLWPRKKVENVPDKLDTQQKR